MFRPILYRFNFRKRTLNPRVELVNPGRRRKGPSLQLVRGNRQKMKYRSDYVTSKNNAAVP